MAMKNCRMMVRSTNNASIDVYVLLARFDRDGLPIIGSFGAARHFTGICWRHHSVTNVDNCMHCSYSTVGTESDGETSCMSNTYFLNPWMR